MGGHNWCRFCPLHKFTGLPIPVATHHLCHGKRWFDLQDICVRPSSYTDAAGCLPSSGSIRWYVSMCLYFYVFCYFYYLSHFITSFHIKATMALIFDLEQLIEMMSIGTLLAYTIVAVCVLILHYQNDPEQGKGGEGKSTSVMRQLWNADRLQSPSVMSSGITKVGIFLYTVIVVAWCTVEKFYAFPSKICLISLGVTIVILILITIIISLQPVAEMDLTFKAPLVPYIPCLSVFANVLLMFQLDLFTWIRFLSWICIGFFMYFCYGMRNSIEAH